MNQVQALPKQKPPAVTFTFAKSIGMLVAVLLLPVAVILLKLASLAWESMSRWWDSGFWMAVFYFALSNIVGFSATIGKTVALRDNPPNLVYAIIGAPTSVLIHISLAWYFHSALNPTQWLAIATIVFGAFLLQAPHEDAGDGALAESSAVQPSEEDFCTTNERAT